MSGALIFVIVAWSLMVGTGAFTAVYFYFEMKISRKTTKKRATRAQRIFRHQGLFSGDDSIEVPTFHALQIVPSRSSLESSLQDRDSNELEHLDWLYQYQRLVPPPPVYRRHSMAPLYATLPAAAPLYQERDGPGNDPYVSGNSNLGNDLALSRSDSNTETGS
ncbi:CIC11C00000004992 [Sungouiella intermedia]|uniref:CIC11C00000004992 n=1 Tax=Sungouiella intermedia TaxID=45354 RepID=A0A1L0DSR7_9ASCO|nr:CIC11C00000004992 [[Candida] intermedia]